MNDADSSEYSTFIDNNCIDNLLKRMKNTLNKLEEDCNKTELNQFYDLYERYLKSRGETIVWDEIKHPKDRIIHYKDIISQDSNAKDLLNKLAVLKLNGGLGTTMGCVGPKSAIPVKNGKNFIDLVAKQLKFLRRQFDVEVPLVLMNSFNTESMTETLISRHDNILTFNQSKYPRISADTLLPPMNLNKNDLFYPPGHGDILQSLDCSGMLDKLLDDGKEYLFISNIDNLAATVDLNLLEFFASQDLEFMMEVTEKTRADIKGGTLIEYGGNLRLLEIAQVPPSKKSEFTSVRKFKIFNTNSAWINLKALKNKLKTESFTLDIIENVKTVGDESVFQLETAIGSAIRFFNKSCGVVVPRSRFLPVKSCSDLFLVESNLFIERNGQLVLNPNRVPMNVPTVKLIGKNFKMIDKYEDSFRGVPDLLELDSLTVSGDVKFGKNVVLKGTVIILADKNSVINIPDGSILDDNIVYGNLPIIEH
ncbi:UTP-glucose-1-phosphate uridylyltransferase (UGP1) [Vairimorpha necatrix]|uniref:UTP--glucose-1-phosphate uridylyltransferase n=1 Tax=Vairimorpha necatrix TaxID=6039 RepID=A0AAX4JBV3_9MICR